MGQPKNFGGYSQKIAAESVKVARRYGHSVVDIGHFLIALLNFRGGYMKRLIDEMEVDTAFIMKALDDRLKHWMPNFDPDPDPRKVYITRQTNEILFKGAAREADRLGSDVIEPEHIFLAIAKNRRTMAGDVLFDAGVSYPVAFDAVKQLRRERK